MSSTETPPADEQLVAERRQIETELADAGRTAHDHARLREELARVDAVLAWLPRDREFAAERDQLAVAYWRARDRADAALAELLAAGGAVNEWVRRRNDARRVCGISATHLDYHQELDAAADVLMAARRCAMTIQPTPWPALLQNIEATFRDEIGVPEPPGKETA